MNALNVLLSMFDLNEQYVFKKSKEIGFAIVAAAAFAAYEVIREQDISALTSTDAWWAFGAVVLAAVVRAGYAVLSNVFSSLLGKTPDAGVRPPGD
jgi:hypothetical protein